MFERFRGRLTYANVMSTIAVFAALTGGGAYAASKIGADDIAKNAVRSRHVKDGAIVAKDINRRTRRALRGSRGPAGAQGDTGATGPPGAKGDTGPPGPGAVCQGNGPDDVMVKVGAVCIDRYEASIWDAPTGGNQITGILPCNVNGQDCKGKIYARSVAGVAPRPNISWFQAQQALANSGKRLPTNAEWQMAVAGTPDSTACNISTGSSMNTGANASCVSDWGANDMVGNLYEMVADWDEQADGACASWPADYGADSTCFGDATPSRFPGVLIRGGNSVAGTTAGRFAVAAFTLPSEAFLGIGFRGAR